MGGVGKTTLLARINNKFDEEVSEFDVVIWVVVSKDLQYKGIQDQILRRLRADQELEKETEEKKASFIENFLRRKKFILLLDDLWSAVDLNKIGVPRPTQENGSKIVFTTRKKEVCRHMRADDELKIDCLSTNEAWELFQNVVGEAPLKKDSEILTLAKKISEKCHGLPLALNVIGKAMSCKEDVHEWRHANDVLKSSSREFPGMEENILSVLKFSYDGLEDDKMKSCFLYCSLFPEDYEIKKEELIEYWINEGFINGKRDEDGSNNKGHVIIGLLVRAHLLMESETTVKMHDVLREMALWIGSTSEKEEEKQCVKSGVKLSCIPDDINWSVLRRISLMSNQIEKISCCPKCPNLSTLFLRDNDLKGTPGKFFQFMPSLVVLDLSRNRSLRDLPEEICSLTSLKYLNLSYTRISSLSVGLKGLRKLISLDLEFTKLKSIDGIGTSLPNLQVLKLYRSRQYIDARSIEELQLLEHLKILTGNVTDSSIYLESIQRVEGLVRCVQRLRIINMSTEVLTLNTVALGGLRELEIINSKIAEIKIDWKCKGKEDLPSPYFKHLFSIVIQDLEGPKELTWLLFAPNLKHLEVIRSPSLEEIINKEKGMSISNVTVPFPKLESLTLRGLPELERICSSPQALPSLKDIAHCPKLPLENPSFHSSNNLLIGILYPPVQKSLISISDGNHVKRKYYLSCDQTLNQTCNCLFGDGNYIHMMKANLEALETTMQELRQRRDDLLTRVSTEEDKGLQRLAQVEGWLSRVARIDSQVSDLLKDEPTETKRLCLFGYFKELLSRKDFEKVAEKRPAPKVGKKHIQTTIGLDSMVEKAWNSIMKPERRTLGIYGMGGVGKTTLLTHINNKLEKEVNGFDVVIWVVVSQDLQYKGIQDQILRRLRVDKEWENQTEEEKASSIDDILGRKKFVLLLDDLWSEVDLNKIGVPHPTQENGSKIVFTTRSKEVCSDMEADDKLQIDCLPANEAWELFRSIVGEDTLKLHQDIPTLAKKICEKCYGLPLALNVIGKAMKYKEDVHEWRHAKKVLSTSSHEFPGMEDKILSVLKFSYDGFIDGKRDEDGSNNEGHVIIGSLVRAHLLMECEKESSFFQLGFIPAVKMHDVLREMALWIGKEEEKQCGNKLEGIPGEFFQFMKALVVLDLSRNEYLRELPEEICSLISLQYLNLSRTEISSLPVGLKGLRKLISLDLEHCFLLRSINGIGTSLPNLQVLKLYSSQVFIDARSIEELQLLEHLKILTGNVKDALILESIQRVERLASCVQRLFIFGMSAEVITLNTAALGGLRGLEIWYSQISEIKIDWKSKEKEDLLCNSSPYFRHLSSIFILSLKGPKELSWLLFAPNLKHLHVTSARNIEEIINKEKGMSINNVYPPDMTVPFAKLESLTLRYLDELKRICSSPPPALPSLRKFVVQYCPKLPKAAIREFQRHEQE
ncbi:unnamed protein product [Brassica rapa subsp. narinosa]